MLVGHDPRGLCDLIKSAQKSGYPPSLEIQVRNQNKILVSKKFGSSYKYWDVASLTKILVTTPLIMMLVDSGRLNIDDPVSDSLFFLKSSDVGKVPVKKLLSHSSGLVFWRPYFARLKKYPWAHRSTELKKIFQKEKVQPVRHSIYSDLDFILLGWIVEEKLGMPLDEAALSLLWKPLGLTNTFFIRHGEKLRDSKSQYAPTEVHQARGIIQGSVFDDNGWSLGGVSGHAGLFSTLEDVGTFGNEYLKSALGFRNNLWSLKTFDKFSTRFIPKSVGDWGLGFSIPSRPVSTGGRNISTQAFGHTGFTGTSLWIDRKRKAAVTILSNRTFPSRNDERFKELRRNIHDAVWEMLDE